MWDGAVQHFLPPMAGLGYDRGALRVSYFFLSYGSMHLDIYGVYKVHKSIGSMHAVCCT